MNEIIHFSVYLNDKHNRHLLLLLTVNDNRDQKSIFDMVHLDHFKYIPGHDDTTIINVL